MFKIGIAGSGDASDSIRDRFPWSHQTIMKSPTHRGRDVWIRPHQQSNRLFSEFLVKCSELRHAGERSKQLIRRTAAAPQRFLSQAVARDQTPGLRKDAR